MLNQKIIHINRPLNPVRTGHPRHLHLDVLLERVHDVLEEAYSLLPLIPASHVLVSQHVRRDHSQRVHELLVPRVTLHYDVTDGLLQLAEVVACAR